MFKGYPGILFEFSPPFNSNLSKIIFFLNRYIPSIHEFTPESHITTKPILKNPEGSG